MFNQLPGHAYLVAYLVPLPVGKLRQHKLLGLPTLDTYVHVNDCAYLQEETAHLQSAVGKYDG